MQKNTFPWIIFTLILISSLFLTSCSDDNEKDEDDYNKIAKTYNNSFLEASQTETNSNTIVDTTQKKQNRSINTRTKAS